MSMKLLYEKTAPVNEAVDSLGSGQIKSHGFMHINSLSSSDILLMFSQS